MAAPGAAPGPGAPPGLEAALQKLALRRKKVLSAEEMELYELAQAAGGAMDPDVFKILVDLLKLNVAPLAVFQMLKSMCAGQRLASEPQDPAAVSLPTSSVQETRGQSSLPLWPRREKQRQQCSQWRSGPGRTQQPGRIQPEDAPTAQCHQAAQGGWAGEEPHPEQYLSRARTGHARLL
ncbi:mitotic-spindle organizing protein 2B isoform X1 [Rhinolophus ferrumequinum]|uniref:mitotic-spindle organizing protein 2B isoform X1 n=1 Tax=Rhinolophus ferrumequinum TaxID=59479 RepID=UPI00140F7816|nr:mitotic-spindle organizing protein 2B isoform X1 [Rhinolophus ferrumequinum]